MHILLMPSWYPDNANDVKGVFFRDQALALVNHGHTVGVIAPELRSVRTLIGGQKKQRMSGFEVDQGLLTYRKEIMAGLPRVPYGNYLLLKTATRKLFAEYILTHGRPDIIHAHVAVFAGAIAVEFGKDHGIPVVLTEHSTAFARDAYQSWQLTLAAKAFSGAAACIAVSPSFGKLLSEKFPSLSVEWLWIPNVVADRFNSSRRYEVSPRALRFLNLALMTEKKGQFDLIKAFKEVDLSGLDAELWLAGDGPIRRSLQSLVVRLGIEDKVHFLGTVTPENVPKLLYEVDCMVVSSHYETFGVVAAEALMAGLPVVATQCGGPECIVGDGDGVLVKPRDPDGLAAAMLQVGNSIGDFDANSIAERARSRFSGSAIAKRLSQVYEQVLGGNETEVTDL